MQRTHLIVLISGLCAFAAIAGFWQLTASPDQQSSNGLELDKSAKTTLTSPSPSSPFAVKELAVESTVLTANPEAVQTQTQPIAADEPVSTATASRPFVDVTTLGYSPMSDTDFEHLTAQLRSNPELLQQLIDELRQETDSARRAALSRLLGEAGGSAVTLTASELIYSGDPEARRIGLELLQQIQPGNAQARDIVSSLLATEVQPDVLVGTLTTLARPGVVDDDSRAFLSEQVAFLTNHEDAAVRSISLNILSRWSTDSQYTSVLLDGLSDSVDVVRESAAYSLVGHEDAGDNVIDALMRVATDALQNSQVRRGSILALRGMSISQAQREQLNRVERELDTRRR